MPLDGGFSKDVQKNQPAYSESYNGTEEGADEHIGGIVKPEEDARKTDENGDRQIKTQGPRQQNGQGAADPKGCHRMSGRERKAVGRRHLARKIRPDFKGTWSADEVFDKGKKQYTESY